MYLHRWKLFLKIFHSTSIHYFVVNVVLSAEAHVLNSHCSSSPQSYVGTSRFIRLVHASITFLFHLGWLVNLPFSISSMTDIVAFEIFSSNFLDDQNLSSFFIFYFGQTYTRNREKKIRASVRLKGHGLCVTQSSNQRACR